MLRIPWLLVYLIIIVVAACIGSNLRSTVMFVSNKNVGALQTQNGITNQTVSFANDLSNNTNIIELKLLQNSTHEDDNESSTISTKTTAAAAASTANVFFDCNNSQYSKCTYFYPSEFYQYYFTNHVRNGSNSSSSTKNELSNSNNNITSYNNISKSMGRSESSDDAQQYQQWRKEIGLENANLPALDSLSWWIKEEEADNDIISNTVQDYMSLPHNITYIQ